VTTQIGARLEVMGVAGLHACSSVAPAAVPGQPLEQVRVATGDTCNEIRGPVVAVLSQRPRGRDVMFNGVNPATILAEAEHAFLAQISPVRDGQEDAIHHARVALRRMREVAALAVDHDGEFQDIDRRLARAGKALGRARDADIALRLTQDLEARFPSASATIAMLRVSVAESQLESRKQMVKALEALEIELLPHELMRALRSSPRFFRHGTWQERLRHHILSRAADVRVAITHASGIYFPRRCHAARIRIKRLRYALELAAAMGVRLPHSVKPLRKAQEALGEAHDREVLLLRLQQLGAPAAANGEEHVALMRFIRAETHLAHRRYLAVRSDVMNLCVAYERPARPTVRRAVAAMAIAVPTVLLLRR
jgi:CHAD domain-containing protein